MLMTVIAYQNHLDLPQPNSLHFLESAGLLHTTGMQGQIGRLKSAQVAILQRKQSLTQSFGLAK